MKKSNFKYKYLMLALSMQFFQNLPLYGMDTFCDEIENKSVVIISKNAQKALDSGSKDGDWVGKWAQHNPGQECYDRQRWMIKQVGKYYRIYSADAKKVLDSGDNDSSWVGKWAQHNPGDECFDRQLWLIKRVGEYYAILSKDSEKALDSGNQYQGWTGKWGPHFPEHPDYDRQLWVIREAKTLEEHLF